MVYVKGASPFVLRNIWTAPYGGLQGVMGVMGGYDWLPGLRRVKGGSGGYEWFTGVTGGYEWLQVVAGG